MEFEFDNIYKAKSLVCGHYNSMINPDEESLKLVDVKLVWYCKTLQNWKALAITGRPDEFYYEVTYNGDEDEFYVDFYHKLKNVRVTGLQFDGKKPIDWSTTT